MNQSNEAYEAALLGAALRKAVDEAPRAFLLTKDGVQKGDLPGHEFRGNQWSGPTGAKELATALKAPQHASVFEAGSKYGGGSISFMTSQQPAKEFHAALLGAGFIKDSAKQVTERTKLGRTSSYTSDKVKTSMYTHPKGHAATMSERTPKFSDTGVLRTSTHVSIHTVKDSVAKGVVPSHLQLVAKGDVPGHEFHGNQYTGGGNGNVHDHTLRSAGWNHSSSRTLGLPQNSQQKEHTYVHPNHPGSSIEVTTPTTNNPGGPTVWAHRTVASGFGTGMRPKGGTSSTSLARYLRAMK